MISWTNLVLIQMCEFGNAELKFIIMIINCVVQASSITLIKLFTIIIINYWTFYDTMHGLVMKLLHSI